MTMNTLRLYQLGMAILPRVPKSMLYVLCDCAGIVTFAIPTVRRNVADNLRHVMPHASGFKRWWDGYRVVSYVMRHYAETLRLPTTSGDELIQRIETSGMEHLEQLAETGGLLIVPHMGSFSLALASLSARGFQMVLVVEKVEPPEVLELVTKLRESHGAQLITLGPHAARAMLKALRSKKIIALAGDRDLTNQSIETLFFGAPAAVPVGPARLALRKIPVASGFVGWYGANQPFFRVDPVRFYEKLPNESDDQAVQRVAQLMIHDLEGYIRQFPKSWGVLQRVWEDKDRGQRA